MGPPPSALDSGLLDPCSAALLFVAVMELVGATGVTVIADMESRSDAPGLIVLSDSGAVAVVGRIRVKPLLFGSMVVTDPTLYNNSTGAVFSSSPDSSTSVKNNMLPN